MNNRLDTERWQAAAVDANAKILQERWRLVTHQWLEASAAYREFYDSTVPDISQLRRIGRRLYELEQQREALKHALSA